MAWRFKASKYKNSTPIVPKFEHLIRDLSIGSYHSHGNFIESSAAFMAFNWDVQVCIGCTKSAKKDNKRLDLSN
jgi:hypothetical protein